jgi:hypothetical protein
LELCDKDSDNTKLDAMLCSEFMFIDIAEMLPNVSPSSLADGKQQIIKKYFLNTLKT